MTNNPPPKFTVNIDEVVQALRTSQFNFTETGTAFIKGECPSCGKNELYISKEKPWQMKCNRLNKCGYEEATRNVFPEVFADFSRKYPATEEEPNRTADAFLGIDRAFDLSRIRGWYEQQAYQIPRTNQHCNTVRFYFDKERTRYWERLIDKTKKDGQKANFGGQKKQDGTLYKGDAWTPPEQELKEGDKCFLVEGVFHSIALHHHDKKSAACFSCNNFPKNFIEQHKGKGIIWILALDGDKAGMDYSRKHARKLRVMGEKYEVYQLPEKQDWDDLHRAGKINSTFLKGCEYRGKLMMAETVEECAYIKYCKFTSRKFVINFRNRLFSVKIDIGQIVEDLEGDPIETDDGFKIFLSNCDVIEICNRDPQCLYREVDEILGEQFYVFKIHSPKGEPEVVSFEGTNIASADAFHKALLNKTGGGIFNGSPADMRVLTGRWLRDALPIVRSIPYIGYDKESETYVFPSAAYHNGREILLNENKFFDFGKTFIRPGLKSVSICSDGKFDPRWLPDFMKAFHWQGVALLAFWLGSLFVQQIRQDHKSFPFFEFTGDPGAGKSTLLEFLWKLVGREGYEGFDVMKATVAGRRRAFNQVSNLPVVIIESDRDSGVSDGKQRQFNFDECKPFYNGRGTGTLGVARRNNDVDESLFQASLIISQNAEVDGSEALLQRVVHCHADKSHHGAGTRDIARFFERLSSEDVSGFLKEALKNEKKILATFFEAFDRIEQDFSSKLKNERIAKNHAQVAACGHALKVLFPNIEDRSTQRLQDYLLSRALLREERLAADHPLVEQFWETFRYLNSETKASIDYTLNHSAEPDQYAINLNHFKQRCRENGQEVPDMKELKKLLIHSKKHELIEKNRSVRSKLFDKVVKCWVFKK
ncbi:toprim domain-containing protein [Maridesulfovibrio ferrireducens]|uniref:toprim domain-containing protein n=1 Tax=Maridesulfovibrio ferrireducens TaxID=246191 RepID=UPI001A25C950|nr:toprim domain-containing protein [Maridesulfovibrio ferrireducens]MBI9109890.1 toprim domain-containing protein [Maridesulfovibrio ferrireducens]